jgi:hypothetical protein
MKNRLKLIIIHAVAILGVATCVLADPAQDACVKNAKACATEHPPYSSCALCSMVFDCTLQCGCPYQGDPKGCVIAATAGLTDCKLRNNCPPGT